MANDHYMPWFFGDFMASTATWTGPERGLYALLLGSQWASGALPCDLDRLARALNYEPHEFKRLWPVMASKFRVDEGALSNARLEAVRAKNLEVHERRVAGGKATAALRWGSSATSPPNSSGVAQLIAQLPNRNSSANSSGIASDPIRSVSESEPNQTTKSAEIPATTAAPDPAPPEAGELTDAVQQNIAPKSARVRKAPSFDFERADYPTVNWEAFEAFIEHRQIIGKPVRPKGAKIIVETMAPWTHEQQASMVRVSRVGGYSGLYDPRVPVTNGSTAPKVRIRSVAELEAEEAANDKQAEDHKQTDEVSRG